MAQRVTDIKRLSVLTKIWRRFRYGTLRSFDIDDLININSLKAQILQRVASNLENTRTFSPPDEWIELQSFADNLHEQAANSLYIIRILKKAVLREARFIEHTAKVVELEKKRKELLVVIKRVVRLIFDQMYLVEKAKNTGNLWRGFSKYYRKLASAVNDEAEWLHRNASYFRAFAELYDQIHVSSLRKFLKKLKANGEIKRFWAQGMNEVDYIIVLGYALYPRNIPRKALLDRLDIVDKLYRAGFAKRIIISGGKAEWGVMVKYLMKKGIPKRHLLVEPDSRNTVANLVLIWARFLAGKRFKAIVITSDYHIIRTKKIFEFMYGNTGEFAYVAVCAHEADEVSQLLASPSRFSVNPLSFHTRLDVYHLLIFSQTFKGVEKGDILAIAQRLGGLGSYKNRPREVQKIVALIKSKL